MSERTLHVEEASMSSVKSTSLLQQAVEEISAHYAAKKRDLSDEALQNLARETLAHACQMVRKSHRGFLALSSKTEQDGHNHQKNMVLILTNRYISQETAEKIIEEETFEVDRDG